MLTHNIKVILRYLSRRTFFTALNVAGLSIGLASCIVIYLFCTHELSYDTFHRDGNKIYRVIRQSQINGMPYNIGVTAANFADALLQDYPAQIEAATRGFTFGAIVKHGEQVFSEKKLLLADSNFFEFFSFPLASGDASSVLRQPSGFVVSRAFAAKYFGDAEPIGKTIRLDDEYDLVVTGVMDDLPGYSHLQFDAVGSIQLLEREGWFHDWWGNAFHTYVKVSDVGDVSYLNTVFPAFMDKYFGRDFARVGNRIGLSLEPLREIYFNFDTRYENNIAHGNRRYVYVFASIGILLLMLASINYINLATAQASSRAKEVGIRKALGSTQGSVALRFLLECFFLGGLSMAVAVGIAEVAIPLLNYNFGLSLASVASDPWLWFFLILLLVGMTLTAGAYPSFFLASFRPVKVLKGEVKGDVQYILVRKALVVFQFAISVFMIISTLFMAQQLRYMREKDLGYEADQLIVVRLGNLRDWKERLTLRQQLLNDHQFTSASFASGYPGGFYDATTVDVAGENMHMRMRTLWTDAAFATTMDVSVLAGRFFSEEFPSDSTSAVVLNETAVRQLGWSPEEALGKRVMLSQFDSTYKEVIGVAADFHFTSLKELIEPLIISYGDRSPNLIVKVSGHDLSLAVGKLERIWNDWQPGVPVDFAFLDDIIGRLYTTELVQAKIFTLFSYMSVVIASIGILGLANYMAAQRRKEIGVRKVLGASARQVSLLLMKDLLVLVAAANVVAIPVCYWASRRWLEGFAYRIDSQPLLFFIGAAFVLLIAALIVGVNAFRAAMQSPASSLRTE